MIGDGGISMVMLITIVMICDTDDIDVMILFPDSLGDQIFGTSVDRYFDLDKMFHAQRGVFTLRPDLTEGELASGTVGEHECLLVILATSTRTALLETADPSRPGRLDRRQRAAAAGYWWIDHA
ncbi:MAG: hypothetical protein U1F87_18440 [Kiritimatiellia bacterium]